MAPLDDADDQPPVDSAPSALRAHFPASGGVLGPGDLVDAAASAGGRAAEARRLGTVVFDREHMRVVARWVSFLVDSFRAWILTGNRSDTAVLGQRLVTAVASHCQLVFRARRRLLRTDSAFLARSLDPAASDLAAAVGAAARSRSRSSRAKSAAAARRSARVAVEMRSESDECDSESDTLSSSSLPESLQFMLSDTASDSSSSLGSVWEPS